MTYHQQRYKFFGDIKFVFANNKIKIYSPSSYITHLHIKYLFIFAAVLYFGSMRKVVALSLLILANIIILAHITIPHHHHNGFVVLICDFSATNDAKEHLTEECILDEFYFRSDSSQNSFLSSVFYIEGFPVICNVVTSQLEIQNYDNLTFRRKPYFLSYHTEYISQSLGLRAPPVC